MPQNIIKAGLTHSANIDQDEQQLFEQISKDQNKVSDKYMRHVNSFKQHIRQKFGDGNSSSTDSRLEQTNFIQRHYIDLKQQVRHKFDEHFNPTSTEEYNKLFGVPIQIDFPTTQPEYKQQNYKGRKEEKQRQFRAFQRQILDFQRKIGSSFHNISSFLGANNAQMNNQINQKPPNQMGLFNIQPSNLMGISHNQDDNRLQDIQEFPNPFIKYKIIPASKIKMALDVVTIDKKQKLVKGDLVIWDYHGGPNQHFYFKKVNPAVNDNRFFIISAATGYSLQVPDFSKENGVNVTMSPRMEQKNQVWLLEPVDITVYQYKIVSFCGKVLDIENTFMRNGNPVIQYQDNNQSNQRWRIWPS